MRRDQEIDNRLRAIEDRLNELDSVANEISERVATGIGRVMEVLQVSYDREPDNRLRLQDLRRTPEYLKAFESTPLVSIVLPTFSGLEELANTGLPSCVNQTYENIEILVVHDGSPLRDEIASLIHSFSDARIRLLEHPYNGPYPDDQHRKWLVTAAPPVNLGVSEARGSWISLMAEDDALRPDAIENVVNAAKADRLEAVYGQLVKHSRDGTLEDICEFPPQLHRFGWQGGVYHSGLKFMQHELADELFGYPIDWSLARRMLRIGVRFGMIPDVVCDYYPSYRGGF